MVKLKHGATTISDQFAIIQDSRICRREFLYLTNMQSKIKKKKIKKRPEGRPPKYDKVKDLEARIEDYFKNPPKTRKVEVGRRDQKQVIEIPIFTISGLVLHCGYCNRASFYDLENKPEFSNTIKRARTMIEMDYEEQIHLGNTCAIFALKNFGWTDKTEHEMSGQVNMLPSIKINGKPFTYDVGS